MTLDRAISGRISILCDLLIALHNCRIISNDWAFDPALDKPIRVKQWSGNDTRLP